MFPGFERRRARVPMADGQGDIHYVIGGKGPPVLMLHGHPQTLFMWHKVAPVLAERFTVVCADLRGYGDSDKPKGDDKHEIYSKRAMAADMVALMRGLSFERFALVGHDRGGRVGHRLCLDHPDAVRLFVPIDISPTLTIYEATNRELATRYFHWFFLIQPYPFPEKLIGHDIDFYMPWMLGQRWRAPIVHEPEAIAEYIRCAKLPGTIHAMCEDYRAADSIDLEHDRADLAPDGRRTRCPIHALWAENGMIAKMFNPIVDFAPWATGPITGKALPGGHYLPEESSGRVIDELRRVL
jgi:haloacetate dehalogenase